MEKIRYQLLVAVLFCVAAFMHLYKIGEIPYGVNVDECGMAYDAYCLNKFGVDRYLKSYPVYLTNFGGGQSALYAYLYAFILNFTDVSVFSMRLPAIILYTISIVCVYKSMFYIDYSGKKSRWMLFLMVISPVYILLFRIGMDCNLMLAMTGIFFYTLFRALARQRKRDYVLAGLVTGILLYSYAISYVVVPLFLLLIILIMIYKGKLTKNSFYFIIPLAILAFPLLLVQYINIFDLEEMHIGKMTITKLWTYRSGEIKLTNINGKSIVDCIKTIFLYDYFSYNSIPKFGNIYYVGIPFAIIGLVKSFAVLLKNRDDIYTAIYVLWFLIYFLIGCMLSPNVGRLNGIYISVVFFEMEGIITLLKWFKSNICKYCIIIVLCISFISFTINYFCTEQDYPSTFCGYLLDEPLEWLDSQDEYRSRQTAFGFQGMLQNYIYYLTTTLENPYDYNEAGESGNEKAEARSDLNVRYKNYEFEHWSTDYDYNYIIGNWEKDRRKELREARFTEHELQYYSVYTFDIENFDEIDGTIVWNSGVNDNTVSLSNTVEINGKQSIVLVGYTYDESDNCIWDEIGLNIEQDDYIYELAERPDVIEQTGNPDLLNTGMVFVIPKDAIQDMDTLYLTAVNYENQKYLKVPLQILKE